MRIIAGEFRRRQIQGPVESDVTRPIPDRIKESLFAILRGHCEGAHVFDGFAGTGAIGLEAISRGAARCTFVERDKKMAEVLRQNVESLGVLDRCDIMQGDALGAGALARAPRPLTLAFLDPPYPIMEEPVGCRRVFTQLTALVKLLTPDGFAVLRTPWPLRHRIEEAVEEAPKMRGGKYASKYKGVRTPGPRPLPRPRAEEERLAWKQEKHAWEAGRDAKQGPAARGKGQRGAKGAQDEIEEVEWIEGAELGALLEGQETAGLDMPNLAEGVPAVRYEPVDLRVLGAVGPETHVYRGMAIHLYARAK